MEGYQLGGDRGRRGKGIGNKKHKWWVQNRQGKLKNSVRNVEAKELTSTIHGHEQRGRWGNVGGRRGVGQRGIKGEK